MSDLVDGRYEDDLVVVTPRARNGISHLSSRVFGEVRRRHCPVARSEGRLLVTYDLPSREISDDLVGVLSAELSVPGWVRGSEQFERIPVGVVRSSRADGVDAWELFYRNTLDRFAALVRGEPWPNPEDRWSLGAWSR